jgi:hypothetical protein
MAASSAWVAATLVSKRYGIMSLRLQDIGSGANVLLILATVTLIDLLSRAVRLRLIGAPSG